jgi:hypothetical protein
MSPAAMACDDGGRRIGAAEQIVGQDGNEGRAREMVAGTQQGVAQTPGMVLGHELEVERPLVAPGHHLEQRLVRIGHHDGPQQSGAGRLVQRPVQHRPERHGEHFLGKPAGDRVEAGPEPAARDDRGIEDHLRLDMATSILYARSRRVPAPCRRKEQGARN